RLNWILLGSQHDIHTHQMVGPCTDGSSGHLQETADHETGSHQQYESEGHLGNDEQTREMSRARANAPPWPPSLSTALMSSFERRSAGANPNNIPVPMVIAARKASTQ